MGIAGPILSMAAASAAGIAAGAWLLPVHRAAIGWGAAGPLAGAVVTWIVVARLFAQAPARVSGALMKLFAAKIVFFAAVVIAAAALLGDALRPFAVSLAGQYIMLHLMEAFFLHRLFASRARQSAQPGRGPDPHRRID